VASLPEDEQKKERAEMEAEMKQARERVGREAKQS